MLIRPVTTDDIKTWLNLSHEWDEIVSTLISDIHVFYESFDDYMTDKIRQNEAFMATDRMSGRCLGIIAFSKTNNRITFLGIAQNADFQVIGSKLIGIALNQLDPTKEISTSVFKSDLASVKQEQTLYESYGFIKHDNTILEAGVPAYLMKKPPLE